MQAVLHSAYGPAEELRVVDLPMPIPGPKEVLVRIVVSSVSSGDCNVRNFTFVPPSMRPMAQLMFGIGKPWKPRILGTELAGFVESIGSEVTRLKVGDRVYASRGMAGGGHAEFTCVPESGAIMLLPDEVSFDEAVAIPFGASVALFYLRELGQIKPGDQLLVLGASGSIGTAAVQLGKYFGAGVTGVCSGSNIELVRDLGADEVIDYAVDDFRAQGKHYDLILDTVAVSTFAACRAVLTAQGVYMPTIMSLLDMLWLKPWTALRGGKRFNGSVVLESPDRLAEITQLISKRVLRPVIDRRYPLSETAAAFAYVETGHKKGNVLINISSS